MRLESLLCYVLYAVGAFYYACSLSKNTQHNNGNDTISCTDNFLAGLIWRRTSLKKHETAAKHLFL